MENSTKLTKIRATYADHFSEQYFAEDIIKRWNNGSSFFTLKTSGSTGKPKEIKLSRELLEWSCKSTLHAIGISNESDVRILCCLPLKKTGGFMQLIRALVWECEIHFEEPTNYPSLYFQDSKYSLTSLTPIQLESFVRSKIKTNEKLTILVGGAPVSLSLIELIDNSPFKIFETYGMTETASNIACRRLHPKSETLFTPHSGVILDTQEHQLHINILEVDLQIKTNDLVKLHSNGFEVLGRADDVINSGGIKIHPAIVEPLIKEILAKENVHSNFYLTKKIDSTYGEVPVLIIEDKLLKNKDLYLQLFKNKLPQYHSPKDIIEVEKIMYTDTGKVIRKPY